MIFVLGGLCLAVLYNAASLIFLGTVDVDRYFDIGLLCQALGESGSACKQGAAVAGYTMVGGLCAASLLAIVLARRFANPEPRPSLDVVFPFLAIPVVILVGTHIIWQITTVQEMSRIESITRQANMVSLENLVWPLLIQLSVASRSQRYRILYLSLLFPVVALSPFRGVMLAVFLFAIAIPAVEALLKRDPQHRPALGFIVRYTLLALGIAGIFFGAVYLDTAGRGSNLQGGNAAPAQVEAKITQRMAFPLFQAHAAKKFSEVRILPGPLNEILRKLRLTDRQNLNEDLYSAIYGGGTAGETTSLYYGEAAAVSASYPIVWIIVGPLALVGLWLLLQRIQCNAGALIGIAIWRGSLGGISNIIPALTIQIAVVILLTSLASRLPAQGPRSEGGLP